MKIGLIAMSGVRVKNDKLIELGVNLPQFVSRGKVIAQLPSLALLVIASLTPDDIDIDYMEVADLNDVESINHDYELVAISSYSAQIYEAYELANRYRTAGIPSIIGGPHVSALPEEAAKYATCVVIGEAEPLWYQIISDFKDKKLKQFYREEKPGTFDLAHSPIPRYDLLEPDNYNRITVQTSRGCPYDCEFCAGSRLFGKGYRQKPVSLIIKELEEIEKIWENPFIEFADDNTFVNKKWSREFLQELIQFKIKWFTETDISIADDEELLKLLYKSGCYQLLIGLESPNRESLYGIDSVNWKYRQQEKYLEAIEKIQSNGISVNGCFIIGLDGDTKNTFNDILNFVQKSKLLEVQITIMTPYPGTALFKRLKKEKRLLEETFWERCTMFDINYRPMHLTVSELEEGQLELMSKIYRESEFLKRKRHYIEIIKALPKRY